MKTKKARIHVKDQYCAGPQCDCGYKTQHTPTPWIQGDYDMRQIYSDESKKDLIAEFFDEDEATLAIRAVNSHESLVKALEGMLEWARRVKGSNLGMEILNASNALRKAEGKE